MTRKNSSPALIVINQKKEIEIIHNLQATGMAAQQIIPLTQDMLINLPRDCTLFFLPERIPVACSPGSFEIHKIKEGYFPAAIFPPPGYTITLNPSYFLPNKKINPLPILPYAAVAFYKNKIYAALTKVDNKQRHCFTIYQEKKLKQNIKALTSKFKKNRLIKHLKHCALSFNCPNAKNFFLQRQEAPLPISPKCNARCKGCISIIHGLSKSEQNRINFIPTAEEISQLAVFHIKNTPQAIVSFGQGCEGEPLLQTPIILQAIKKIRAQTTKGIIHLNTNASLPSCIEQICKAGLDSIRISINSFQKDIYHRYYRPINYSFEDVIKSIKLAKKYQKFISINYLTIPGLTDWRKEYLYLKKFLIKLEPNMLQLRNLNYDPYFYFKDINTYPNLSELMGIKLWLQKIKKFFPKLLIGYFNPYFSNLRKRL